MKSFRDSPNVFFRFFTILSGTVPETLQDNLLFKHSKALSLVISIRIILKIFPDGIPGYPSENFPVNLLPLSAVVTMKSSTDLQVFLQQGLQKVIPELAKKFV